MGESEINPKLQAALSELRISEGSLTTLLRHSEFLLPGGVGMPFLDRDEGFCSGAKRQILSTRPRVPLPLRRTFAHTSGAVSLDIASDNALA